MHSPALRQWDLARWLSKHPLLYGVWHPYKQCVSLVYRHFFPLMAVLECAGTVPTHGDVRSFRKVLYTEKMFAALLLLAHDMQGRLAAALLHATTTTIGVLSVAVVRGNG